VNVIVPKHMMERNREVVKYSPFLAVEGQFEREGRVLNVVGTRFRELRVGKPTREKMNYRSRDFH
jgi:hypothetical protein